MISKGCVLLCGECGGVWGAVSVCWEMAAKCARCGVKDDLTCVSAEMQDSESDASGVEAADRDIG